jgi:hypothetical protein
MRCCVLVAILGSLTGCFSSNNARLGYDALAREELDRRVIAKADAAIAEVKAWLAQFTDDNGEAPAESLPFSSLLKDLADLKALALEDIGRAQIMQLYYGAREGKDVPVVTIGDAKDNKEVVSLAGLATLEDSKRNRGKKIAKGLGRAVAGFASEFVKEGGQVIVEQLIPTWLLWILVALFIAFVIFCGLAFWQWFKIRFLHRAVEQYDYAYEMNVPKGKREPHANGYELQHMHRRMQAKRVSDAKRESERARRHFADSLHNIINSSPLPLRGSGPGVLDPEYKPDESSKEEVTDGE